MYQRAYKPKPRRLKKLRLQNNHAQPVVTGSKLVCCLLQLANPDQAALVSDTISSGICKPGEFDPPKANKADRSC
jgi:hypothetical protein